MMCCSVRAAVRSGAAGLRTGDIAPAERVGPGYGRVLWHSTMATRGQV